MAEFLAGMDAFDEEGSLTEFVSDVDDNDDDTNDDDQNKDDDQGDKDKDDKGADADDNGSDDDADDVDKDIKDKSKVSTNTSTQYSALTTAMGETLPFLQSDDEIKIGNADEFQEYITTKIEDEVQAREFADLNDTQKKYVEALRAGVPEQAIQENLSMESQINSITEEALEGDESLRENLIYQSFKQDGLTDARAKKLTKLSIDSGDDVEAAKESLIQLKAGVQKQLEDQKKAGLDAQKKAKDSYDKQMKQLKDTINAPEDVLGTKKLATKYKEELYDLITKPQKHEDKEVNFLNKYLLENPVNANIVLAHLFKVTDGFNPEKISGLNGKTVKSKAAKSLSKLVEQGDFTWGNDNESVDLGKLDHDGFDHLGDDTKLF